MTGPEEAILTRLRSMYPEGSPVRDEIERARAELEGRIKEALANGARVLPLASWAFEVIGNPYEISPVKRAALNAFYMDGNTVGIDEALGQMPGVEAIILTLKRAHWTVRVEHDPGPRLQNGNRFRHSPLAVALVVSV